MSVQFIAPLERSWNRARRILFHPFRLEFWMVLGFAAFLANLTQGGGGGNWAGQFGRRNPDGLGQTIHDYLHSPFILWAFGVGFLFLLLLGVVLAWVSSRGQFVFLEDVLYERAVIVEPWKRYARVGNSLFLFTLLVGLVWLAIFLVLFGPPLFSMIRGIWEDGAVPDFEWVSLLLRGLVAVPLFIGIGILHVLTRHFVVPLMLKYQLGAVDAWRRFWPLLARELGAFIVYLLLLIVLNVGLAIAVLVVGFCTCCIGFLFFLLPYISSVVLLPVHVIFRGFGPEFMAQFGEEWDVRPQPEPPPVASPELP